jgi:hypothetical protein
VTGHRRRREGPQPDSCTAAKSRKERHRPASPPRVGAFFRVRDWAGRGSLPIIRQTGAAECGLAYEATAFITCRRPLGPTELLLSRGINHHASELRARPPVPKRWYIKGQKLKATALQQRSDFGVGPRTRSREYPCDGSNFGKVRTLKMEAGEAFQAACRGLGV